MFRILRTCDEAFVSEHTSGLRLDGAGLHVGGRIARTECVPERGEVRSPEPVLSPEDKVILVAEDEPVVRNLIQLMLVKEGFVVLTASDGQEALEVLEQFKGPVHLLVTDVRMPRLDGWTLAEKVRKLRADTKVIVISGETATQIAEANPADAFLRKPFIPPTLLQCIQRVLISGFLGVCDDITQQAF